MGLIKYYQLEVQLANTVAAKTYGCKGKQNLWIVSPQ